MGATNRNPQATMDLHAVVTAHGMAVTIRALAELNLRLNVMAKHGHHPTGKPLTAAKHDDAWHTLADLADRLEA